VSTGRSRGRAHPGANEGDREIVVITGTSSEVFRIMWH